MSVLESSVRKLVREEAASAATETVDGLRQEVCDALLAIRGDIRTIASAELKLTAERLTTWSRLNVPRPEGSAERPADTLQAAEIVQWRLKAVELAQSIDGPGAETNALLASAEKLARFLIDGCLDGERRPIVDLPQEEGK